MGVSKKRVHLPIKQKEGRIFLKFGDQWIKTLNKYSKRYRFWDIMGYYDILLKTSNRNALARLHVYFNKAHKSSKKRLYMSK